MQKRMHSREFKLDVVRQVASGQKRPAQACREYGLAESVLSRWRKEYQERGESCIGYSDHPFKNRPFKTEQDRHPCLQTQAGWCTIRRRHKHTHA
jgi:transposase-like protein